MQLLVIAKEPRPGFAKTRLCPPCTPAQAAAIADASLADTLAAVRATPADRYVVALDGEPGPWLPDGFEVIDQRTGGLGERLAGAFGDCFAVAEGPVLVVGMDTPQLRPDDLRRATAVLEEGADAVLGPATDGGYWLLGLRWLPDEAFTDVPMSRSDTGAAQVAQLEACGMKVGLTRELRDIDHFADAGAVATDSPGTRLAAAVQAVADAGAGRASRSAPFD